MAFDEQDELDPTLDMDERVRELNPARDLRFGRMPEHDFDTDYETDFDGGNYDE